MLIYDVHLRGAIKIENRENLGQCPNRGGGAEKKQKCPNFNLGILKTEGGVSIFQECPNFNLGILKTEGGGLYFSKMSQFQLFDSVFCNITFIRNV